MVNESGRCSIATGAAADAADGLQAAFEPYAADQRIEAKWWQKPWIVAAGCISLVIVGYLLSGKAPEQADTRAAVVDVSAMTASELAQNAGVAAARELARRMINGTPQEQISAAQAVHQSQDQRLTRNLAMGMAIEQQKKHQEQVVEMERLQRDHMADQAVSYGR